MTKTKKAQGIDYANKGKDDEALRLLREDLNFEKKLYGLNEETLNTMHIIGEIYARKGIFKEATMMFEQALAGREEMFGRGCKSTLDTMYNLGKLYLEHGKLNEGGEILQRAVAGRAEFMGQNNLSTLEALDRLRVYLKTGKFEETEDTLVRALVRNDLTSSATFHNIGILYYQSEKYLEAEALFKEALDKSEASDPQRLETVNALGVLYGKQEKLDEAEAMFGEVLGDCDLTHADIFTLKVAYNLGLLYREYGDPEAEGWLKKTLTGFKNLKTDNHELEIEIVYALATVCFDQTSPEKGEEAAELYRRTLELLRVYFPDDQRYNLLRMNIYFYLAESYGRLDETKEMLDEGGKMYEEFLQMAEYCPNDERAPLANMTLEYIYKKQGRSGDAERVSKKLAKFGELGILTR